MVFSSNQSFKLLPIFFLLLFPAFLSATHSHQCTPKFYKFVSETNITKCQKLTTFGAELGWSDPQTTQSHDKIHTVIRIVFGAVLDSDEEMGWLAWGVNPGNLPQMVGTRAVIGLKHENQSLSCNSYNVTYETKIGCRLRPSELEEVKCNGFYYDNSTDYHIVSATLNLSSVSYNISNLNIVWQIGYDIEDDQPLKHTATLQNVDSIETLNLFTEKFYSIGGHTRARLRQAHGILNIIGWGTLLPLGVIIVRYFKHYPFECKVWGFNVHVACQILGFSIGIAGWIIGLWLGHASKHYVFLTHRIFAIFIFSFTTLQAFAIWLRPKKGDEFRKYWDIYHHFLGYALITVIIINIFKGIEILKPSNKKWKCAVISILSILTVITLLLEYVTWYKFCRSGAGSKNEPPADHRRNHYLSPEEFTDNSPY